MAYIPRKPPNIPRNSRNKEAAGAHLADVQNTWHEYLMEAGCLVIFMVSACLFTALLASPQSGFYIASSFWRPAVIGLAMGATLLFIVHTPWGKQSGAHMNPAVTLTFLSLGKITPGRAAGYIAGQFMGGIAGVLLAFLLARGSVMRVNFAVTQPGPAGAWVAFAAESLISFLMMITVLNSSNSRRFARWTPYFAAGLVALFITFEARLSGMSMNPAGTVASAFAAGEWTALWVCCNITAVSRPHGPSVTTNSSPTTARPKNFTRCMVILERGDYVPREKDNWNSTAVNLKAP